MSAPPKLRGRWIIVDERQLFLHPIACECRDLHEYVEFIPEHLSLSSAIRALKFGRLVEGWYPCPNLKQLVEAVLTPLETG